MTNVARSDTPTDVVSPSSVQAAKIGWSAQSWFGGRKYAVLLDVRRVPYA
jgi:hypothetical protein